MVASSSRVKREGNNNFLLPLSLLGVAILVVGSIRSSVGLTKVLVGSDWEENGMIKITNRGVVVAPKPLGDPQDLFNISLVDEFAWVDEYAKWHNEMRRLFPDTLILDHPDAPPVLILFQHQGAGGLTDRFLKLGTILHTCYAIKRVLLIKWYDPMDLEHFLAPNMFNWTVPNHPNTASIDSLTRSYRMYVKFRESHRAYKVTIHRGRLVKAQIQMDPKYEVNVNVYWHACFRPSVLVQSMILQTYSEFGLVPGQYSAIHCRIRHPAHDNTLNHSATSDYSGLVFEGKAREKAILTAIHAIECSNWLSNHTSEPVYFYADSEHLVDTVINFNQQNTKDDENERKLHNLASQSRVVGRHVEYPNAHLETLNLTVDAYASTFVDLYIAALARCVSIGVGRFAYFATRLSGTECRATHQLAVSRIASKWGMKEVNQAVPNCPVPQA
jgi:hypothetical protein